MFEDDRTREQDRKTAEAFADPKPGDRFHEMYSSWMIVVSAGDDGVKVMSGWGPTNITRGRFPDGEIVEPFPDRAEVRWYATAEDFRDAFRYGTIPGYSMMLADRDKIDVTGWLERAEKVPSAPTHPAPKREPVTPYDDLPIEVRRANWGWFGNPWWSYVCYDEDGRLISEMRKDFPAGESCPLCGEQLKEGDSGQAMPAIATTGTEIRHVHKECQFMNVAGGLAHHEGRCRCHGGTGETPTMTLRQEALEVWQRKRR